MGATPRCPTCRRQIDWSEAYPYRPFCSERCRLIDLGAWLSEQRSIPDDEQDLGGAAEDFPAQER